MDDFTRRMLSSGKGPETTSTADPKIKDARKFLRRFFGTLSAFYFVIFVGAVANVILLLRENPEAHLSPLYLARALFVLAVSLTFVFTVVKFNSLVSKSPETIRLITNVYFWGSVLLALVSWYYGSVPNILGLIVQVCIYVSLLKAIDRILNAAPEVKTAEPISHSERP